MVHTRLYVLSIALMLFALSCGQEQPAEQTAPAPAAAQAVRPPVSPVVNADRTVTFSVLAPESKSVMLTVTGMPDTLPMNRDANGIWSLTVGPLAPEIWEYSFLIDTVTSIDTYNIWTKDEMHPQMSQVEVPADPPAFYEYRDVPHGSVTMHLFRSASLEVPRSIRVYTPPGYNQSRDTYPVLYLLHGGEGEDRGWTTNGRAHLILDNLIADGKAQPMIIVMTNGQYRGEGVAANAFEQDLLTAIIPLVEKEYRVKTDKRNRAMAGLSMGGGQTLDIGLAHPELFAWIGVFSNNLRDDLETSHAAYIDQANANLNLFWFGVGESDPRLPKYQKLGVSFTQKGIKHSLSYYPGAHEWSVWRMCLRDFAPNLFK